MQKAKTVLAILSEKSKKDENFVFQRLYRNLFCLDLYMLAYARIYKNEGNMTPGIDEQTIDGFSKDRVYKIIELMKTETYYPNPVRRSYIPKKGGRRPLGISSFDDKLVQEIVRQIIEAIYEPLFSDCSHGFRPNRSCQTALHQIRSNCRGTNWVIEGDIEKFYDTISIELYELRRPNFPLKIKDQQAKMLCELDFSNAVDTRSRSHSRGRSRDRDRDRDRFYRKKVVTSDQSIKSF